MAQMGTNENEKIIYVNCKLEATERQALIEKLIIDIENDNNVLLQKIRNKMDK